jgi:spore maturation protein CgeB
MISIFSTSRINLNLTDASQGGESQIKGRNFEVPACGGFLLTGRAADLNHYYDAGKEIVVFADEDELVRLARYYLDHESERREIASAGHRRTLAEHTYDHRFRDIFAALGV